MRPRDATALIVWALLAVGGHVLVHAFQRPLDVGLTPGVEVMAAERARPLKEKRAVLEKAGFSSGDATAWCIAHPELGNDFGSDGAASTRFWDLTPLACSCPS